MKYLDNMSLRAYFATLAPARFAMKCLAFQKSSAGVTYNIYHEKTHPRFLIPPHGLCTGKSLCNSVHINATSDQHSSHSRSHFHSRKYLSNDHSDRRGFSYTFLWNTTSVIN